MERELKESAEFHFSQLAANNPITDDLAPHAEIMCDLLDDIIMPRSFEIREVYRPSINLGLMITKAQPASRPQAEQNVATRDKTVSTLPVQNIGIPDFEPIDDRERHLLNPIS